MKFSIETLMEKIQYIVLELDESQSQEEPHAFASFGSLSQASFR